MFKNATNIMCLDDDYTGQWIVDHSDLNTEDIGKMCTNDNKCCHKLLASGCGLDPEQKPPKSLHIQQVMSWFLQERYTLLGTNLNHFKAKGGMNADGTINKKKGGNYKATFAAGDNGKMIKIEHRSGDVGTIADHVTLTKKMEITNPMSDFSAALGKAPVPPCVLASFFAGATPGPATGPWKVMCFKGQPDKCVEEADRCFAAWKQSLKTQGQVTAGDEVKRVIAAGKKAKTDSQMSRLRAAAKQRARDKKLENVVEVKDSQ